MEVIDTKKYKIKNIFFNLNLKINSLFANSQNRILVNELKFFGFLKTCYIFKMYKQFEKQSNQQ